MTTHGPQMRNPQMRNPQELLDWAKAKYARSYGKWLALPDYGASLTFSLPLHPPTQAAASVALDAVAAWTSCWQQVAFPVGCRAEIERKKVNWHLLGAHQLPQRVTLKGAASLAALAHEQQHWATLVARATKLHRSWPEATAGLLAALPKAATGLGNLSESELDQLISVVTWLVVHPQSGMLPRQIPVPGVDSKWLERHRPLVQTLKTLLSEDGNLGLGTAPVQFAVRVLSEDVVGVQDSDPRQLSASVAELARLSWKPDWVLLVENYQTLIALPPLPKAVAVFGRGKAAPDLAAVPWIRTASHLLYWGDLDTHGMHILGITRKLLPQTESLLMDEKTLERFSSLAVKEPRPFTGVVSHLTADELVVLNKLQASQLRLEQERIDIAYAEQTYRERFAASQR